MEDEPCCLLGSINVSGKLHRGDALLVGADQIHCNEPFPEGYLCVLKDGSCILSHCQNSL